jgi:hypothetical protein
MASIGLTIPAIAVASSWLKEPLLLGLVPTQPVLLALTIIVAVLTVVPGRAIRLQGGAHLVLLAPSYSSPSIREPRLLLEYDFVLVGVADHHPRLLGAAGDDGHSGPLEMGARFGESWYPRPSSHCYASGRGTVRCGTLTESRYPHGTYPSNPCRSTADDV